MKETYSVEYCSECNEPVEFCECKTEDCCPRCEEIKDILDEIYMTESNDEVFEILK